LQLDALPSGQVGVFPEQRENWEWLGRQVARAKANAEHAQRLRVLNLFAYTGASTLAAAAAGAEVVHIDAAQNIVDRARENAALSGLADRPIRWIAEDALKFCRREVKRGNKYDAVILDPPSYGHGPKREPWKIGEHLLPLLQLCGALTAEHRAFVIVTCHSPGIGPAELAAYLSDGLFGHCGQPPATGDLFLETADGRRLPSGVLNFGIKSMTGAPSLRSSSSIRRRSSGSLESSSMSVATTSSAIGDLPSFSSAQTRPRPASKRGRFAACE
jgi:23S rRNA (cytosine1962-C5)-methyltransferase